MIVDTKQTGKEGVRLSTFDSHVRVSPSGRSRRAAGLRTTVGKGSGVVGAVAIAGVLVVGMLAADGLLELTGADEARAAARSGSATVVVVDNRYEPPTVQATAGEPVVWRWANRNKQPHTVTALDGSFDSDAECGADKRPCRRAGHTFQHTFPRPGTYHYRCKIHALQLGVVEVEPASDRSEPPPDDRAPVPVPNPTSPPPAPPGPGGGGARPPKDPNDSGKKGRSTPERSEPDTPLAPEVADPPAARRAADPPDIDLGGFQSRASDPAPPGPAVAGPPPTVLPYGPAPTVSPSENPGEVVVSAPEDDREPPPRLVSIAAGLVLTTAGALMKVVFLGKP